MSFNWKEKTDDQAAKLITDQHGRLVSRRQIYDSLHEKIVRIFRPRRYDILGGNIKGKQYGANIFDQQPANALNKFVGGKLGYMVSRRIPWLQFIAPDRRLMELDHIKEYCQNASEQVLYGAGRSNFYSSVVPHALDAHSIGTSVEVPMIDPVRSRVVFDVVHPRDSFIAVDKYGYPNIYHRELTLTAITALDMFGADMLPAKVVRDAEGKDPFAESKFIWAVYPNDDRDMSSLRASDKPWAVFCVMQASARRGKSKLVLRDGRDDFPICWRSGRESGADYGTSLAADCLTSALQVNKLGEKALMAAHKVVDMPVVYSNTLRRSLHLNPGGRTPVNDILREGVKSVGERIDWPISDAQMQRLHDQLDDRFFIKFFSMLGEADLKARTAYEVSQMMGEKAVLMSSIVGTFEEESLEPAIEFIIKAETEAGRMPEPPDELLEAGSRIDLRYLGPLAQLQRSLLKSKGIIDSLSIIGPIMEMHPPAGWKINWMELIEEATISQGLPQKLILSDDEVRKIQESEAQKQQALEQAEMMEKVGKTIPNLGKPIAAGSPAAAMMEEAAV